MFEGFSGQARRSLQLAWADARRQGHDYLGTEHLFVGLVAEESGSIPNFLRSRQIQPEKITKLLDVGTVSREDHLAWDQMPLTPRAREVLEEARAEADSLGHDDVDVRHLFLALLKEPECIATQLLEAQGLDHGKAREALLAQPAPVNRDHLLEGTALRRPDPSAGELASLIAASALPETLPRSQKLPEAVTSLDPAALDRALMATKNQQLVRRLADRDVLYTQLRILQYVLGATMGALAGAPKSAQTSLAAMIAGLAIVRVRIPFLGGILGLFAGMAGSYFTTGAYFGQGLILIAGIVLGFCLDDWRIYWSPPTDEP